MESRKNASQTVFNGQGERSKNMQYQKIFIFGAVVVVVLAVLWFMLAALTNEKLPNMLRPPLQGEQYVFDYVIVGAGTCGSVVASLLGQHSNGSVLLVEAGEQFGLLSKIPLLATFQQKGLNDWAFMSVPQRYSSKGLHGNRQCLPRGKGVGGSAQLNYMIHYDGNGNDFNNWAEKSGLHDWTYKKMKPFLETAKNKPSELFHIESKYSKITEALELAKAELSNTAWHLRRTIYTIKKGLRYSVVQRFLQPALNKHRNLLLMPNTMAKKILLTKNKQVDAILLSTKNAGKEQIFKIKIRRELILSAGAYQSPQLLLASGIGDENELKALQIPVQHNLAMVGKNLHDHLNQPLFVSIDVVGPTLNQRALLDPFSIINYLTAGTGHLGNFGVVGHLDANFSSETTKSEKSSYVYGLTFFAAGAIDESALMSISNFQKEQFYALFPRYYNSSQEGFVVISNCLQPKSRGSVKISTNNTRQPPLIDPNYLADNEDLKCTIKAIRTAVEVVQTKAFSNLNPRIHWPRIKACAKLAKDEHFRNNKPSDQYLECIIRHVALGSHHPGGTCALGTVLDSQFRVNGLKKLRVIDASALPTPVSGNPNTVLVAMAIKGATKILKTELQATITAQQ